MLGSSSENALLVYLVPWLILHWLWERRWGRVVVTLLGCLAVLAFVAQAVGVLTNLYSQFAPRQHAKATVPGYVRDGYYVEDHQKIFDLGPWRDISPSERNETDDKTYWITWDWS